MENEQYSREAYEAEEENLRKNKEIYDEASKKRIRPLETMIEASDEMTWSKSQLKDLNDKAFDEANASNVELNALIQEFGPDSEEVKKFKEELRGKLES